jgi:hypothetical protein
MHNIIAVSHKKPFSPLGILAHYVNAPVASNNTGKSKPYVYQKRLGNISNLICPPNQKVAYNNNGRNQCSGPKNIDEQYSVGLPV